MVVDDNKEVRDYLYQAIKTGKPVPTKGKTKAYILKRLDNVRLYVGYIQDGDDNKKVYPTTWNYDGVVIDSNSRYNSDLIISFPHLDDLLDYASKNQLSIKFEDKHGVPYRGVVLAKTPNGNYIIGDEMDRLVIVAYLDPDNSNFCNVRLCLFGDE